MTPTTPLSRRAFLAASSATALSAMTVLSGCRQERSVSVAAPPPGPDPAPPTREPIVRVRVSRLRDSDVVIVGSEQDRLLVHAQQDGRTVSMHFTRGACRIRRHDRAWHIADASNAERSLPSESTSFEICHLDPDRTTPIALDEAPYPGSLRFVRTSSGRIDVVNHVPLESYLPGVLHKELFSHWHEEAFAAQAIAARSFACTEHAFFSNRRHFDLVDTAASQAYVGTTTRDRPHEAVAATRGVVLMTEDRLVPGYYSSCCGGAAAVARDVIGPHAWNDCAPLRGSTEPDLCTEAPVYTWKVERSIRDASTRLAEYGRAQNKTAIKALGRIKRINVAARNPHGRPTQYDVQGDKSTAVVSAFDLHRGLDTAVGGKRPAPQLKSAFISYEVDTRRRQLICNGRGFGHGAGLCQYGAQAHARAGRTAYTILEWYYPGVLLRKAWT